MIGAGDQLLGQNGLQRHGKLHPDLLLVFLRENAYDPVDGVGGGAGMKGAEDQVPRFGGGQRRFNGFPIPELADQDNVRIFPERRTKAGGEPGGIPSDLPLVEDAAVGGIAIFNGVFQSQDVAGLPVVDVVNHGRESCGFPASGFTGDQDDSPASTG